MRWKYVLTVCSVILVGHAVTLKWHDDAQAASGPRIEARTDGISVAFLLAGAPPGTVLHVSVKGPEGELAFESRQPSPRIEWLPEAGAREGRYRWEAYAVLPAFLSLPGRDEEDTRRSLESRASPGKTLTGGVISFENGVLTAEQRPSQRHLQKRSSGDAETYVSSSGTKSQIINDFAEIVGATPTLYFDDTSTSGTEWKIEGFSQSISVGTGSVYPLIVNEAAAHGSVAIDQDSSNGNARVGIGTASPIRDIEIQSTTPSLLFDESDFGVKYQLGLRDGTLRYQSIDTLDIPMRIENGAPQNAFYVEDTGDIGFGTSSPTAALHIADPRPEISLHDTDDSQSWILRNYDFEGSAFQIFDPGTVTRPFQIQPGAPNNTLYLEDSGQVGIGTNQPLGAVHVARGVPGFIFDDTDDSQTWEMYSNGGPLYFIDVTNSTVPIIVREGARTNAIHIGSDGRIGLGTPLPAAPLHVVKTDNATGAVIEDASGTTATRQLLTLSNNGPVELGLINSSGTSWRLSTENDGFAVRKGAGATKLAVRSNGDLEAAGTLTEGSSIAIKENIVPIHGHTVLSKLDALQLSEWSYIGDPEDRHLGPMAEDFHAIFGLGPDNRHIAPKDLAGVALVAAKTLRSEMADLKAENERLRQRIEDVASLEDRVRTLEAILRQQVRGKTGSN